MSESGDSRAGFPADGHELTLRRPHGGGRGLRAWDAADEQLVSEAWNRLAPGQRVAVVDDGFGALTLGLAAFSPTVIADGAALGTALARNANANDLPAPAVRSWQEELGALPVGKWPVTADQRFDAIILKVPRQQDYLEFLLRWANQVLRPGGWLLTGGMIKHLPDQAAKVYQRLVTTDAVLPARKKARLVLCSAGAETLSGWRGLWKGYTAPGLDGTVQGLPAVFARDRLDIGTRELLPFISGSVSSLAEGAEVLDLACGNGILGLRALVARPDLAVTLSDVSSQAVLSVRANQLVLLPESAGCRVVHGDGVPERHGGYQRILLNPPFHDGGVVGDHIALRLFAEAASALSPEGELLMVGNRHLGYHKSLRSVFAEVEQLRATPKFVVFRARRPRPGHATGRS